MRTESGETAREAAEYWRTVLTRGGLVVLDMSEAESGRSARIHLHVGDDLDDLNPVIGGEGDILVVGFGGPAREDSALRIQGYTHRQHVGTERDGAVRVDRP